VSKATEYARDPFELMHYAHQVYVSNPFKIPKLRKYYENLPLFLRRSKKFCWVLNAKLMDEQMMILSNIRNSGG
jgi:hypothetical protein